MAIGLALFFGLRLPANFLSPYKAESIVEFWRRWHITLSAFLRTYLYVPLGGNRKGPARQKLNLMVTMLLGGLWHGANWTFVAWGALHGVFLLVNHAWRSLRGGARPSPAGRWAGRVLTFVCVVAAWVFFRAESFAGAASILGSMAGLKGLAVPNALAPLLGGLVPTGSAFANGLVDPVPAAAWVAVLWLVAWFAPNTAEMMARWRVILDQPKGFGRNVPRALRWQPSTAWSLVVAALAVAAILALSEKHEFIYFNF